MIKRKMISFCCEHCGKTAETRVEYFNRAKKIGGKLFCGKKCSGLARRTTTEAKKKKKAEYDKKLRNGEKRQEILQSKKDYFKRTYDVKKAAEYRKKRAPYHLEYCRKPEYKEKKKVYDETHRCQKHYGEYWEAELLLRKIKKEIDGKEERQINQLKNKTQKRKKYGNKEGIKR